MAHENSQLLSWLIFSPLLFAGLIFCVPQSKKELPRTLALIGSLVNLALGLYVWMKFDGETANFQFTQKIPWLPMWGVSYELGLDGISLPLMVLTVITAPLAILGTWPQSHHGHAVEWNKNEKFFSAMILALQTGMLGTFLATDLFLFYVFWEVVLIPMYFMIGIWGGKDRIYATMKFFCYTMVGSLLMLVAIFWLVRTTGTTQEYVSTSFTNLLQLKIPFDATAGLGGLLSVQGLLFLAFAFAFTIKVPMVPFHTWLPDAHVQAPTIGSVFLAAVLLKMGTYGLMRIAIPLFPDAARAAAPAFMILGVIGIIYGALCAMVQTDIKKLVAYSSVSHMGYIIIGLFSFQPLGLSGSLYQMVNHGISTGGLFLIVGFLYERLHTRELDHFGGLAKVVPVMSIAFLIVTLSSIALPGTNGLVGEFTILLGSFLANPWIGALAGLGVILGAIYALKAYQKVMLGPITQEANKKLMDLNFKEMLVMSVLTFLIFGIGIFPNVFFGKSRVALQTLSSKLQGPTAVAQGSDLIHKLHKDIP